MLPRLHEYHHNSGYRGPLSGFVSEIVDAALVEYCDKNPSLAPLGPINEQIENPNDIHRAFSDELREKVLLRLARREPVSQIAEATGISKSTIRRWKNSSDDDWE